MAPGHKSMVAPESLTEYSGSDGIILVGHYLPADSLGNDLAHQGWGHRL
jgi:hypothetical protein